MPRECEYCNGTGTVDAPMTNADLIRAMNDRQLAEFLAAKFTDNTQVQEAMKGNHMTATQLSETSHAWFVGWMTWLQQPVDGERKDNERKVD